ncbi:hypothetical protein TNIN_484851 [Trichonephila inaurata madagascariensis]|uniref:Uncharacterized protein n=1 Tax=Trichonephila inaurata madagascariensis TaxID=2747483 RepID=A0A8X7CEJ7_9ARAC|nr:hypothetical protein TNIN_484851 [Trichonephila inaurata madagascariensis]
MPCIREKGTKHNISPFSIHQVVDCGTQRLQPTTRMLLSSGSTTVSKITSTSIVLPFFDASNSGIKKNPVMYNYRSNHGNISGLDTCTCVGDADNPFMLPQRYFICSVVNEMHVCFSNIIKICHHPVHYNCDRSVAPNNNLPG